MNIANNETQIFWVKYNNNTIKMADFEKKKLESKSDYDNDYDGKIKWRIKNRLPLKV